MRDSGQIDDRKEKMKNIKYRNLNYYSKISFLQERNKRKQN